MSVCRGRFVNGAPQIERFYYRSGAKVEFLGNDVGNFAVGKFARAFGVDEKRNGLRNADRVSDF